MSHYSFFELFEVINFHKVFSFIESPMDFEKVENLLRKYSIEAFPSEKEKILKNFNGQKEFLSNRDSFNKRELNNFYKDKHSYFLKDIEKIIFLKSIHIKNAPELITIDVIQKEFFDFMFLPNNQFKIVISEDGKHLIKSNLEFIKKIFIKYNIEISNFY